MSLEDSYDPKQFPPFAVTVDLVILTIRQARLCALMVRRTAPPFRDCLAFPGGFVAQGEGLEAAARGKLATKTGVSTAAIHLEQLQTYGAPDRDPRMRVVSVAYLALAADLPEPTVEGDSFRAQWCPVDELLESELAFDHKTILRDGVSRARGKLEYTTLATCFCPAEFTLAQLRDVYETVWGCLLDAPNFRRKVLAADGFVVPTARSAAPDKGRPAQLYRPGEASALQPPFKRPPS